MKKILLATILLIILVGCDDQSEIKGSLNNTEANLYRVDTNRFIAHAGGEIDGYKYTNTLEAVNTNYKKGFRLFELDIIKTADNIYVAAHDWKSWAINTGHTIIFIKRLKYMFYAYQIIIWLIFLLFISSKIKKKNRRILFSIIVSFFTTLEIAAVYMTEKFIDYRFYNHMNLNAIEGHGFQFVSQFISFVCLFIFLSVAFYFISKKMNTSTLRHNKFFIPVVLTSFILLSLPNGVFNETYKIYEILDAEEKDFNQALTDVGISPEKYITPDQLTAQKGKNIIVISLESLNF